MTSYNSTDLFALRKYSAQTLLREQNNLIRAFVYAENVNVTPEEGTCTILDESGNVVISVNIYTHDGTGAAYAEIPATALPSTLSYSTSWRVKWNLLLSLPDHLADGASTPHLDITGSTSHDVWQVFEETCYLVRSNIIPTLTNDDLLAEHYILSGMLPDTQTTWNEQLASAWKYLYSYLLGKEKFAHLILDSEVLRPAHMYKTLSIIFTMLGASSIGNNNYLLLADKYEAMYKEALASLSLIYDIDEDGNASEGEKTKLNPIVFFC